MLPVSMVSRRLIVRQSVDLPEPEGPITTTTSPRWIVRSMSWSTCSAPKCLFTLSSTTSWSPAGAGPSAFLVTDTSLIGV